MKDICVQHTVNFYCVSTVLPGNEKNVEGGEEIMVCSIINDN